jgi:pterin-4a-carbinolamine dehydratase
MSEVTHYTEEQAQRRLEPDLAAWSVDNGHLCRSYSTNGWRASMLLANGIAHLAEAAWHHPDLAISWGSVGVRLRTHDVDSITDKDFALARMIERTATWQPDGATALDGAPTDGQWRYVSDT